MIMWTSWSLDENHCLLIRVASVGYLLPGFVPQSGLRATLSPDPAAVVTTADYVGQTTVFVAPAVSDFFPVFDGALLQVRRAPSLLALPLDPTRYPADSQHDVYGYWDGDALQIGSVAATRSNAWMRASRS